MADLMALSAGVFGQRGAPSARVVMAKAVGDSSGGLCKVDIGGGELEVRVAGTVKDGDSVPVVVQGGSILGIGGVGGGDRVSDVVTGLKADHVSVGDLEATNATIKDLKANTAHITNGVIDNATIDWAKINDAHIGSADIDVASIRKAIIEQGQAVQWVVKDGAYTGELTVVRLDADVIKTGTLSADRLMVKGADGDYYLIGTEDGGLSWSKADSGQLEAALDGSHLVKKSVTADRINVSDLVAFGATIGGTVIEDGSIHTAGKTSAASSTGGLYAGSDGQFGVGDGDGYVRVTKSASGKWGAAIKAEKIEFSGGEVVSPSGFSVAQKAGGNVYAYFGADEVDIAEGSPTGSIWMAQHTIQLKALNNCKLPDGNTASVLDVRGVGGFRVNGVEMYVPKSLYGNNSGTNGTVTLSDDVSNYLYLMIYYGTADTITGSVKFIPNGLPIDIGYTLAFEGQCSVARSRCAVSGKVIKQSYNYQYNPTSGEYISGAVYIRRVEGYVGTI